MTKDLIGVILSAIEVKKGYDIVVLDIRKLSNFCDYFIICSGRSPRQTKTISNAVEYETKQTGQGPIYIEGLPKATWVLLDFGNVVTHVFTEETRRFYELERLWIGAEKRAPESFPRIEI